MQTGGTKFPKQFRFEIAPWFEFLHLFEKILTLFCNSCLLVQITQRVRDEFFRFDRAFGSSGGVPSAQNVVDFYLLRHSRATIGDIGRLDPPERDHMPDGESAQRLKRPVPVTLQTEQRHIFHFHYHAAVSCSFFLAIFERATALVSMSPR